MGNTMRSTVSEVDSLLFSDAYSPFRTSGIRRIVGRYLITNYSAQQPSNILSIAINRYDGIALLAASLANVGAVPFCAARAQIGFLLSISLKIPIHRRR